MPANDGRVTHTDYIYAPTGLAAICRQQGKEVLYVLADHMGSVQVLADAAGRAVTEYRYEAWGGRVLVSGEKGLTDRGYTGHEHLEPLGLIDMNGRIYDPTLARFLSPDPYVQAPDFTQGFNRYSYCLNNPFKYTDPSGENPILIAAIIIGAYLGGSAVNGTLNPIKWDYSSWQTYAGIAIGGLAGWAGSAAGASVAAASLSGGASSFVAGIAGGAVGGMASGGINGAGLTAVMGGDFDNIIGNMMQGAITGAFAGASSAAAFQGMDKLLNVDIKFGKGRFTIESPFKILPTNTLSYMAGSTASQMTVNMLNGENIFEDIDYGLNIGILCPLAVDALKYTHRFNIGIANKYHKKPSDIIGIGNSETTIMPNGDLRLEQSLYVQEYFPNDFRMEITSSHQGIIFLGLQVCQEELLASGFTQLLFQIMNGAFIQYLMRYL